MKNSTVALALLTLNLCAQNLPLRQVPARNIPVPNDVSPEMQKLIARPIQTGDSNASATPEGWKSLLKAMNDGEAKHASDVAKRLHVKVESATIAGVHVFYVKPELVPDRNSGRLMMHVHGGAYVAFGGMAATTEAVLVAYYAGIQTVSVDYRMPPDAPFPAAVDDSIAVWRELIKTHNPAGMALFGTSAGGGLSLATVPSHEGPTVSDRFSNVCNTSATCGILHWLVRSDLNFPRGWLLDFQYWKSFAEQCLSE